MAVTARQRKAQGSRTAEKDAVARTMPPQNPCNAWKHPSGLGLSVPDEVFGRVGLMGAGDYIYFHAKCACGEFAPVHVLVREIMFVLNRQYKDLPGKRVVLLGGCNHGDYSVVRKLIEALREKSVPCVWLDWNPSQFLQMYKTFALPSSHELVWWEEIAKRSNTFSQLHEVLRRGNEVLGKIERDRVLLERYKVASKVRMARLNLTSDIASLFRTDTLDADDMGQAVLLINPAMAEAVIVTKSKEAHFKVSGLFRHANIAGGDLLAHAQFLLDQHDIVRGNDNQFLIQIEKGHWQIPEHPALDWSDPDFRYIPMSQRIKKVKK